MKDLFATDTKKSTKKGSKTRVVVEIKGQEENLKELVSLDEQIALLKAQRLVIDTEVREESREAMINHYNEKKSFPGTLTVKSGDMELQFITADRYKVIDEDRANELTETYGEDLVETTTKFSFNTDVLMRNSKAINKMIMKSKDISDTDKENLIEQDTTFNVVKGTIKNLKNEIFAKFDLSTLIDDIKPVFSIKAIKDSE